MHHLPTGTVTLLFTDIEGSTQLLEQLGKRYTDVQEASRSLLRSAFHSYGGHEVDTQGDSFFVAFARATDALSAAVDAQRALAAHAWPEGVTIGVRMGLHTGEPTLSAEGYIGLDVHRAARIMSAGHGGQVLLSQTTCDLVEHDLPTGVSLRDLGAHRLKDLQQKSHLYQLVVAGLPADFPALKTLDSYPHNLPVQPTPLIGREQQVAAILRLLSHEEVRLVTLTGPGGTGKTRLGLRVAAELSDTFTDGVYFVDLAPLSDPHLVVRIIAQTLDIQEVAGQPLLDLLKGFLHWKHLLLLLDNFEQVVDAALDVADLLAVCPNLKVMVTSRMPLHVRGEQEFAVPPLAVPDPKRLPDLVSLSQYEAVALFISRSQAVKPEFQVNNANAPTIAEICVRLDGLPLAIELAAARIKVLPPQALLARLGQRLAVLTSGSRDAPARQQTLRNTIAWSYDLLDAQEQRLFRRLSVFAGGCALEAIETICVDLDDGGGQVLDGVASLLDKSLLQQIEQEGEEPRFVMLETIREYGLECLIAHEMVTIQRAHAVYYLTLVEGIEPELKGAQQRRWLERLEREHANLWAVEQWLLEQSGDRNATSSREMTLRLGVALFLFWSNRGYWSEGRDFIEQALMKSEGVTRPLRARALDCAGILALYQADYDRAEALCGESLSLYRELGDNQGIDLLLNSLGIISWMRGKFATSRTLVEEYLAHQRQKGNKTGIAAALFYLAMVESGRGGYASAHALLLESLGINKSVGNKEGIARALTQLAWVVFVSQGDQVIAHSLLEEVLTLWEELGHKQAIGETFCLLGQLDLHQGNYIAAHALAEKSLVFAREGGNQELMIDSLFLLARVATSQSENEAARAFYEESLAVARKVDNKPKIASGLEGLAEVVAAQGKFIWAAWLWGAAESLRESIDAPLPPIFRSGYEDAVATARIQCGEKTFSAAWAEGQTMTPEQALAAQKKTMVLAPVSTGQSTSPIKPQAVYPDGLTAREVEVLRLVAQGLSDAQVAAQLVISPRTVNTHLKAIYSKIGVTSRSGATRYAMEHKLV